MRLLIGLLAMWCSLSWADPAYRQVKLEFPCGPERCTGYLHLPVGVQTPPVVVMGGGLATEWRFGTRSTIERFTQAGYATFNFDYRYFGESGGQPRQVIDIAAQLDDWRAALAFLRTRSELDPARIALWGSSLGGGHVLSIAAEDAGVKAVLAQVPHVDSRETMKTIGIGHMLKAVAFALWDKLHALLGLEPYTVPLAVEPGEFGFLSWPGWKAQYLALVPADSGWKNAIPARSLLLAGNYNPVDVVDRIKAPVQIAYGEQDPGIPVASIQAAAKRIPAVELQPFAGGHFDVYSGPLHEWLVVQQIRFLQKNL